MMAFPELVIKKTLKTQFKLMTQLCTLTFASLEKRKVQLKKRYLFQLQQAVQENPVILMPNHRSYMDFLAISYILFSHDIPVPLIAAGVRKYLLK